MFTMAFCFSPNEVVHQTPNLYVNQDERDLTHALFHRDWWPERFHPLTSTMTRAGRTELFIVMTMHNEDSGLLSGLCRAS